MKYYQQRISNRHQKKILISNKISSKLLYERIFSNKWVSELVRKHSGNYRDRIFPPLTTIWVYINQILNSDHSDRAAVASLITFRSMIGAKINSIATGAYCRAKARLTLDLIKNFALESGRKLISSDQNKNWLWRGFDISLVDGSFVSVPDTVENRLIFHKAPSSCGLPKARVLGFFSLSTGAIIDFCVGPWQGKGTGEVSMFRALLKKTKEKQLILMDRLFSGYYDIWLLKNKGIDFVIRANSNQFRKIVKRNGKNDFLVSINRPSWRAGDLFREYFWRLPEEITLREVRIKIKQKGYRVKKIILITSLENSKKYTIEEIADLYNYRWNVEIDFRSLKIGLKMDVLRSKTPGLVEKEIWMHILTYNLIRIIMADASNNRNDIPRNVSFNETVQIFSSFRSFLSLASRVKWKSLYRNLINSIKTAIGKRPGRREPRLIKHNPRKFSLLKKPRNKARYGYWKHGTAYSKRKQELKKMAS